MVNKKESQKQGFFSRRRIFKSGIGKTILVFCILVGIVFLSVVSVKCVFNKTVEIVGNIIMQEQKRDFEKFETIIFETQKNLTSLNDQLNAIQESKKRVVTDEVRVQLFERLGYLENDSLKIETALMNYHNDLSVQLYSQRDKSIDEKINSLWNMHVLINRLVRNVEDIAFSVKVVDEHVEISKNILEEILKQFEKMNDVQ